MDILFKNLGSDWPLIGAALLLFFAVFAISFMLLQRARAGSELRRRAAGIQSNEFTTNKRALRAKSLLSMNSLINTIAKNFDSIDPVKAKVLRSQLIQAGLYDPRWVPSFFALRTISAVVFAVAAFFFLPYLMDFESGNKKNLFTAAIALVGYMAPVFWLSKRIQKRAAEHRAGFPDFMDLLVVCADAGVSMESSLGRVGGELAETYPSLSSNLHLAVLEMRAGKSTSDALEHLGERLSIEEARTFATLLQQSEELGSSLTDALRVYSDEMRHKRLSRAEEKAHALPAKLVIPLGVFIFPILFVVILLPAAMKISHLN
ncbi:MAG: type II secretion system F family protein [Pseudomonadota bacterium]